ncbi:MAG: 2OG-Fe dioxygenase family protein [Proteobacteria bacterium]|nr:2OG-Fe dioxygenase family protein [Pseudomonadota bacterium]
MKGQVLKRLKVNGFAFLGGRAMRGLLGPLPDWSAFAESWGDMPLDRYMRAGYRRRRHAVFEVSAGKVRRLPRQPHYQSPSYNHLFGGKKRWFSPIRASVAGGETFGGVLSLCEQLFGALAPSVRTWRVEAHQFRIEARAALSGEPTPEGRHRDGVDFVLALMIRRENIARGTTTMTDSRGRRLGAFTLARPLDAAWVDDRRVHHGVTAVRPLDPKRPAHRDVLVVTFRRKTK